MKLFPSFFHVSGTCKELKRGKLKIEKIVRDVQFPEIERLLELLHEVDQMIEIAIGQLEDWDTGKNCKKYEVFDTLK